MAIALTWSDNQNGTGGIATITGSASLAINTVYAQLTSNTTIGTYTSVGGCTGDGSVSASLGAGSYWVYCLSSGAPSGASPVVFAAVTNSALCVHSRCLNAVQAICQAVPLAGITSDRIYRQITENDKVVILPAVFVTFSGGTESPLEPMDSESYDHVGYPVFVRIVDRNSEDYVAPIDKYLKWRRQLMVVLRSIVPPLPGVPEIVRTTVEPESIAPSEQRKYQYFVSGFSVRCYSVEARI